MIETILSILGLAIAAALATLIVVSILAIVVWILRGMPL